MISSKIDNPFTYLLAIEVSFSVNHFFLSVGIVLHLSLL